MCVTKLHTNVDPTKAYKFAIAIGPPWDNREYDCKARHYSLNARINPFIIVIKASSYETQ